MENQFHKNFKLNGALFSSEEELIAFSENISSSVTTFLTDWFNEKDFVIVQTSGSTGKPKPIQLQKEFMKNSAFATGEFFGLKENTTALLCLSTDYIAGKMMLVRALTLGWQLDVIKPDSNPLKDIKKQYNFSAMVPLQLRNSLNELHKIDQLIVGGGVVSNDLIAAIQNISTKVFATYGMTETITHVAVKKLNDLSFRAESKSLYKTLPNVLMSQDDRNCLIIEASKVSSEIIRTNDVVKLISKTAFEWLGRYDNVVNSGGIKLHPEKIEEKLSEIIDQRFFVTAIKDEVLGEKLVLVIEDVTSSGVESSLLSKIKKEASLSKFEIPKVVYFLPQFIETETKKIQRKKTLDLVKF
ncbi:AMP-binding protein [Tenacibaculum haliotis]|uniref:AMP-binding protein n=1 Tax=Tenacibaculum haliotis TaxID=1888914 RepID=UPI0021AE7BFC|nr:AMP-binding protein [Tenacibaculum haliotis]MCT4699478.1 AMP-binding protein [Tenacibaculum haliotis]